MKCTVLIAALWCVSSVTAQKHPRPDHPLLESIELEHLGGGIQFKLKHPKAIPKHLRGNEDDSALVNRLVQTVTGVVKHLADGNEAVRVFRYAGIHEQKHIDAGLHRWYRLDMAKTKADEGDSFAAQRRVVEAVNRIRSHGLFEALEHADPEFKTKQHYVSNDAQISAQMSGHYNMVRLPEAWDLEMGSPSTVVQVIDSGIDMDHPDLQNNKWSNPGEICGDGADNDGNGFEDDCQGYNHADNSGTVLDGDGSHGTHCAGTVAADSDNGVGVAGVAGGQGPSKPGASLMISTVFGQVSTSGFAEALVYGGDNGAHISSNSWGYTSAGAYDQSVLDAMDYAEDNGVVVVFAAGNDNSNGNWYPGVYPSCVAVAATDSNNVAASFTNYGSWIDISAPGVNIISTVIGGYSAYSGTSMACPHVAGGLALAKSYYPLATPETLTSCLFSTAKEIESGNAAKYSGGLGAGLMDIRAMLECMGPSPTPAPSFSPIPSAEPVPAPTKAPIVCGSCDHTVTLVLRTDNYATESSWLLDLQESNPCFEVVDGPDSSLSTGTSYTITLSSQVCENMNYQFTFFDSYGDGICCGYGSGFYRLEMDGEMIFESSGAFGSKEEFVFAAEAVGPPAPTPGPIPSPTKSPVTPPTPSPSKGPIPAPTKSPVIPPTPSPSKGPIPDPTQSPVFPPTKAPTKMPVPAPTKAPLACPDCSLALTLVLSTDQYASESSWALGLQQSSACFTDTDGPSGTLSGFSQYSILVSDKVCDTMDYDWAFFDSFGDGICCGFGSGTYRLELDGQTIFTSAGNFGSAETFSFTAAPAPPAPAPAPLPVPPPTSCLGNRDSCSSDAQCCSNDCTRRGRCKGN